MKILKKTTALVLMLLMLSTMFALDFSVFAKEPQSDINDFISGIKDLAKEYDADKNFEVTEETDDTFNTSSVDENETSILDGNAFQTARLIVRANGNFNDFAALEHIKGFKNFHILQYKTAEDAEKAYNKLISLDEIIKVAPDEVIDPFMEDETQEEFHTTPPEGAYWDLDRTQCDRLLDRIENNNIELQEVVVGVIDDGIHYDHEMFEGRLVRTYFNASSQGAQNDEYGCSYGHGTATSSMVVAHSPDNVKVAMYKIGEDEITVSQVTAAYLQAIIDGVDLLSVSLAYGEDLTDLTYECVQEAKARNIPFFVAAGNSATIDCISYPVNISDCIVASAVNYVNYIASWATMSPYVDVSAPAEEVLCAYLNLGYKYMSGTSFAAPYAAALGAIIKSQRPDITVKALENLLKDTVVPVESFNFKNAGHSELMDTYLEPLDGDGMIQFCDAFDLAELSKPELSLKSEPYVGVQECRITCADENAVILYTTDGMFPDLYSATEYTVPFEVNELMVIRAVAYYPDGGYYSDEVKITPRIHFTDDDSNFVIDESGIISDYTGSVSNLHVNEVINGITVTGFTAEAFNKNTIVELTLPQTVKVIPEKAFVNNESIVYIKGTGVETIENSAFSGAINLIYAVFPNVKVLEVQSFRYTESLLYFDFSSTEIIKAAAFYNSYVRGIESETVRYIEGRAFYMCFGLRKVILPNCTEIVKTPGQALNFASSNIMEIYLPKINSLDSISCFRDTLIQEVDMENLTELGSYTFKNCWYLTYINLPNVTTVPKCTFAKDNEEPLSMENYIRSYYLDSAVTVAEDVFSNFQTRRIEFSKLETTASLPGYCEGFVHTEIMMPSTFRECTEDTTGRNYRVYGTRGTYAEEWAHEYGHTFIEVTPETAIINDVDEEYNVLKEPLVADIAGFNKTYQWYASDIDSNKYGTPIEGATSKTFNPEDYPYAQYYYCVVTSTDVGYDPITITTGVCENTLYEAPKKSCITNVTYEPSRETRNTFTVTVDNRPAMIQFIEPDGGTRTYDRNNKNVSIKSYDADGNEVNSLDRKLSYEIWSIFSNMSTGARIKTRAKYLSQAIYSWDKTTYDFVADLLPLDYAVRSVTPISESGRFGAVQTTVVTGPDAEGIRFVMPDGSTTTYLSDKATTLNNGDLEFISTAWANNLGVNVVKVEVKVGGKWKYATAFRYEANDYPASA